MTMWEFKDHLQNHLESKKEDFAYPVMLIRGFGFPSYVVGMLLARSFLWEEA